MDIYRLLHEIVPSTEKWLHSTKFTEEQLNILKGEADKKIFVLLRNISSIDVNAEEKGIKFSPRFEYPDGTRTFLPDDLSNDDLRPHKIPCKRQNETV